MYSSSDESYIQARAIKKGEHKLSPLHQGMADWVAKRCHVSVLDFTFFKKETSRGYRQQVIYVIVERIPESKRPDLRSIEPEVVAKFIQYFKDHDASKDPDPLKRDVHPFQDGKFPETYVEYRPLEEIELQIARGKSQVEFSEIEDKYPCLWKILMSETVYTLFYTTNAEAERCGRDGTKEAILDDMLKALKKYDEFNYFGPHCLNIAVYSKEDFDKYDKGDWLNYYR